MPAPRTTVLFELTRSSQARMSRQLARIGSMDRGRIINAAVENGAIIIQTEWRDNIERKLHRNPKRHYARSVTVRTIRAGPNNAVKSVGSNLVYAPVHEFGATILPRTKRLLSWIDHRTRKRVFARKVTIPARPTAGPAFKRKSAAAFQEMKDVINDYLRRVTKSATSRR